MGGVPRSSRGLSTEPVTQRCGSSFSPHSLEEPLRDFVSGAQAGIIVLDAKRVIPVTSV